MIQPIIEQILVGKPQAFGQKDAAHPMDREWESGIVKHAVTEKDLGRKNEYGRGWTGRS